MLIVLPAIIALSLYYKTFNYVAFMLLKSTVISSLYK